MAYLSYAGDVTPQQAWDILASEPASVLVDVRTDAEWAYVGVPDLSALGKQPLFVPWLVFPGMKLNADFTAMVSSAGPGPDDALVFICRSGQRSKAAAGATAQAGFRRCYNLDKGFEGDGDAAKHRGVLNGWKVNGLPWVQG